jgi:hypothetical protein
MRQNRRPLSTFSRIAWLDHITLGTSAHSRSTAIAMQ